MTLSKIKFYGLLLVVLIFGLTNFTPKNVYAASASLIPLGLGNNNDWLVNTGSKVDAVASNDSDTSFISASSTGASQTFVFPGAGVPAGASINFVTLTAFAKQDSGVFGAPQIIFLAENGSSTANDSAIGRLVTNSLAYSAFSWKMTENPLTHAPWTEAEVNSWTTNFGVSKSGLFGSLEVTQITLSVDFSVHELPAVNPVLANQTCGLDIALVLDSSGSIGGNLPAEKAAFNSFVTSLLPATPTYFSVTYFDGVANYALSNFSNSQSSVVSAISGVPGSSGQTNWEDALIKAGATFDPRPGSGHPNLIVFASDGQPNRYGPNGSLGVGGTVDLNALDAAVAQANIIKTAGTRIVTLGIGSSVNQANMEAISSPDGYYSVSDFSQLATTLNTIAGQMCGSTVTATKIIDQDGSLQTSNDQTPGVAWQFNVGGSAQTTDSTGKTAAVALNPGTYSVSETAQSGFSLISAGCSGATNNGTASGTTISGLAVNGNDIVSCTFYNKPTGGGGSASSSDVSILKTANKITANPGDTVIYTLVVKNNGPQAATGVVASDTLPSTLNFISSVSTVGIYNASTSLWNIGSLSAGASATTTITATVKSGTAGASILNTGTVTSVTVDNNLLNNSSNANLTVNSAGGGGGGGPLADISILKIVDNPNPNPGDTVTYTLVVKNLGPDTANAVVATDTLSSILTFISSTSTQGSFSPTTSVWTLGTLLNGQSATTTIVATVNAGSAGQSIANSATVASTTADPNPDNNISTAGLVVPTPPSGGGGGGSSGGGGGSGGSSGGGSGGGGGGLPIIAPIILGVSTGTIASLPMPQVLGETLPRTGTPLWEILALFFVAAIIASKKFRFI